MNAYWELLAFELPGAAKSEQGWRRLIDTGLDSPDDICDGPDAPLVPGETCVVQPRSVVVLFALKTGSVGQDIPSPGNRNVWSTSTEVL